MIEMDCVIIIEIELNAEISGNGKKKNGRLVEIKKKAFRANKSELQKINTKFNK